jgi:hypothetical protein
LAFCADLADSRARRLQSPYTRGSGGGGANARAGSPGSGRFASPGRTVASGAAAATGPAAATAAAHARLVSLRSALSDVAYTGAGAALRWLCGCVASIKLC